MIKLVDKIDIKNYRSVYVVGDIHGCFSLLEKCLSSISFDKERDLLICVGDLVGRGQESHMALEYMKKDWFKTVVGNHDIAFFDIDDVKYSQFYSGFDEIEAGLIRDEKWLTEFNNLNHKTSFFIEIYNGDELLDLVCHAAFHMKSVEDYKKKIDDFIKYDNKDCIGSALWNRGMASLLNKRNYEMINKGHRLKNYLEKEKEFYVDGIRNIYTGHNIIHPPLMASKEEKIAYLKCANFIFMETCSFYTDEYYSIGLRVKDNIDYGMSVYNVTKNKFELVCKK